MLFSELGQANRLRESREGLQAGEGKLAHWGMTKARRHPTLAYANEYRSWEIDQDLYLFLAMAELPRQPLPGKHLRLDSVVIDFCVKAFSLDQVPRRHGAVKLRLLFDHDGLIGHYG